MSLQREEQKAESRAALKNQCTHCYGKFGLIRRSGGAGAQFCSALCMESHARKISEAVEEKKRWYAYLRYSNLSQSSAS